MSFEPPSAPVARQVAVRYSFWGAQREMGETFVLDPDERRITSGLISVRRLGIMGGPGLVLLTDKRLCVLVHYAFRRDKGLEFPRGSLTAVRRINLFPSVWYLRLNYRAVEGPAHIDVSDIQARGLALARMGQSLKAEHLIEAIREAWGPQAPGLSE